MLRTMMKSKIHRVTVTQADLPAETFGNLTLTRGDVVTGVGH